MAKLAGGTVDAHHLGGAEGFPVEIDGARRAVDDEVGRQGAVALRHVLRLGGHGHLRHSRLPVSWSKTWRRAGSTPSGTRSPGLTRAEPGSRASSSVPLPRRPCTMV